MKNTYHIPALLNETIEGLNINPEGTYVDVTFGGGGHSKEILNRLNKKGRLIAFDQDDDALKNIIDDRRFTFVHSNFQFLTNFLRYNNIDKVDGILADLGVSFHHFDTAERGFSFRFDGQLDMRMNKKAIRNASDIIKDYNEEELARILYYYGELKNSRKIASKIVKERKNEPITTINQLVEIVKPTIKRENEKKELTLIFQALRIEVNRELDTLKEFLKQCSTTIKPDGRLAILTYHSLEDRLVKNFIKTGNFEGKIEKDFFGNLISPFVAVNRKIIVASNEEIEKNPRSRSAKLRIAKKNS